MSLAIKKFIARRGPKIKGVNTNAVVLMSDGSRQKISIKDVPKELIPKRIRSPKVIEDDGDNYWEWFR